MDILTEIPTASRLLIAYGILATPMFIVGTVMSLPIIELVGIPLILIGGWMMKSSVV